MVRGEPLHATLLLPGPVQEWIMDFDWGAPVKPLEFDLAIPAGSPAVAPVDNESKESDEQFHEPAGILLPVLDLSEPNAEPEPVELCFR